MAYEVVKQIGSRQYRYRVQSERDPASGKVRNRWTYIGKVAAAPDGAPRQHSPRRQSRVKLLDAIEALLGEGDVAALTIDAIVARAGLAHGTFYRYFHDRGDALESLARHIRETRGVPEEKLRDDVATAGEARVALGAWVTAKLDDVGRRLPAFRVWYALIASDARLAAYRDERRAATLLRMSEHFTALTSRGFARLHDPPATAAALFALIDGLTREIVESGLALSTERVAAAAEVVERAVTGDL